jgi:hypothetical protein
MIAALGDLRGGQRFTQLSKALLAKHQFSEFAGSITFVASDMLSYIEPLQLMKEHRLEAQRLGMAAGDIHCACMSKLLGMCDQMWSGTVLSDMKKIVASAQEVSDAIRGYKFTIAAPNPSVLALLIVLRRARSSH